MFYIVTGAEAGGAKSPVRSRRGTFVDDKTEFGEGTRFLHRNKKRNHILHPHNKRFRREAENPKMYMRGQRADNPEERLKRVKKFNPEN